MLLLDAKDRDTMCDFLVSIQVPPPVGVNIMKTISMLSNLKESEPVPEPAPKTNKDK